MRSSPDTSEALDSSPASASRAPRERLIRAAVGAAILVALAWFIVPVFGGSYTEGFESTIAINAREIIAGRVDRVDLLYPFSGRFFLVTRLGSEVVLGAVGAVTGFTGLVSFRLVMLASLLVLVGSIVASSPVIAPLSDRIALSLTYRTDPVVESRTDHTA